MRFSYRKNCRKALVWIKPFLVNLSSNEDKNGRGFCENPFCYAEAHCRSETETLQYLAVESSYGHQVEQAICLLTLGQLSREYRQQSFLEVPKVVCPSLRRTMLQV